MGWHPDNQRLHRVHSNGPIDLQSGGLAVSESMLQMTIRSLRVLHRFTWGIEMTCKTSPISENEIRSTFAEPIVRLYPLPPSTRPH